MGTFFSDQRFKWICLVHVFMSRFKVEILCVESTFVHLCEHSEYSLIDGLVRVESLLKQMAEVGILPMIDPHRYGLLLFSQAKSSFCCADTASTPHRLSVLASSLFGLYLAAFRAGNSMGFWARPVTGKTLIEVNISN
jgi:hypothetical protein